MKNWLFVYGLLCCSAMLSYASSHHPQEFLSQVKGNQQEGALIYEHFCSSCHALEPLIALGAPRKGQSQDWLLRLQQPVATLLQHTEEGLNAMPPRGGCFECSDEQLILALLYMLPEKEQKKWSLDIKDHKKTIK